MYTVHRIPRRFDSGGRHQAVRHDRVLADAIRGAEPVVAVGDDERSIGPQVAREMLYWHRYFHTVRSDSFKNGEISRFPEGGPNALRVLDRSAFSHPDPDKVSTCPVLRPAPVSRVSPSAERFL